MQETMYRIRNAKNLRGEKRLIIEAKRDHTPGSWGPLSDGTWVHVQDVNDIDGSADNHTAKADIELRITSILRRRGCVAYNAEAKVIWQEDAENEASVAVAEYE